MRLFVKHMFVLIVRLPPPVCCTGMALVWNKSKAPESGSVSASLRMQQLAIEKELLRLSLHDIYIYIYV